MKMIKKTVWGRHNVEYTEVKKDSTATYSMIYGEWIFS